MKYIIEEDRIEAELAHGELVISGDDTIGYRPVELLVSSVASCSGAVFRTILNKQRTQYESLSIEATVERNENEANRVEKMILHFTIEGTDLKEEKLMRNLAIVKRHCGMMRSVEDSIEVVEKLTVVQI